MNLDQAIKLNNESESSLRNHKFPDHADAILLGIEALKRVKVGRRPGHPYFTAKLPGEDSIEDTGLSDDRLNRVQESPLGKEPGA